MNYRIYHSFWFEGLVICLLALPALYYGLQYFRRGDRGVGCIIGSIGVVGVIVGIGVALTVVQSSLP